MPDRSLMSPNEENAIDPLSRPLPNRRAVMLEWLAGEPLVPPAVGLIAGISLDAARAIPIVVAVTLFIITGMVTVLTRHRDGIRHFMLMLAALAVGVILHDNAFRRWPENHIVRYCGQELTPVRLTATVINTPAIRPARSGKTPWYAQSPQTHMLVSAEKIEGIKGDIPVCGTVAVKIREPVLHAGAGDRVELFGQMHHPLPPANPGAVNWSLIQRRNGILIEMSCEHAANVIVLSSGNQHYRWLANLRQRARAAMLDQTFPGDVPGSNLLTALVLGQRSAVDAEINEAFIRSGTVHYLSVSGVHVGMLASAIWLAGWLAGASRRTCAAGALVIITAYAILAEPRPSILRAALMADLFCLAILLRRPVRSANWLAAAAIVLLVFQPMQLFAPGFQLSFLTVTAVIYLTPRVFGLGDRIVRRLLYHDEPLLMPEIQRRLNPPSLLRRTINGAIKSLAYWLAIGISAWLVAVLVAAYHFQRLAVWGWFNTVVVLPLVWLALLLGLAKTVATILFPPLAWLLGGPLVLVTDALIRLVDILAHLPGAGISIPALPGWLVVTGMAVLGLWILSPWLRITGRWVAMAGAGFILLAVWNLAPAGPSDTLSMHVLSVSDGTACVIRLPNAKTYIYDIGSSSPYDLERWTVGPLLAQQRAYRIDAVILSHPNLDHYSGLPELIERRNVTSIITTPHFEKLSTDSYGAGRLVDEIKEKQIPLNTSVRGDRLTDTGEVTIDVLWPPPVDELNIQRSNDTSIVLRIGYAGYRVLHCGDIQEFAQRHLLASADLKADVLILPHHGGVVSNTRAFIEAVNPQYCIRSSGQHDKQTANGLLELITGRSYFNTADDGAVEIRVTPTNLSVEPYLLRFKPNQP